jgi:hypothetical protein
MAVFNDGKKPSHVRLQYGTAKRARNTIRRLRGEPIGYQKQAARTMYYRAFYHKHQTKNMKDAARIYKQFLHTLSKRSSSQTRKNVS